MTSSGGSAQESCSRNTISMEAPKLRFVRCPGCLQLLVEYPTIAVYQCGGCGTILRAKNRVAPAVNANAESGEHNEFSNNSTGGSQNNKLICTDGQKIPPSSDAQPGVLQEKITFASEEKTMSSSNSIDSSEHVNIECSLLDGDASNHDVRTEGINDEDKVTVSNSSLDSVRKVENVETDGNEKGSFTDDGSISNEVATTQSMVHMDGAGSDNNFTEVQSAAEGKCALSDANLDSQEIVAICQPDNISVGTKERVQPYEGFNVESHEDLIEELVRSLSLSDDEEEFVDIAENSELNDALCSQMGSCRFSLGSKMNEGPRTDPHGRLIEELEMSFSDAEEPLDQNIMVSLNDIEKPTLDEVSKENHILEEDGKESHILDVDGKQNHILDEHGKENHILNEDDKENLILDKGGEDTLDAGGANSYEERVLPSDDGLLKSGQSFQQCELVAVNMAEKDEGHLEETNMANHAEANKETNMANHAEANSGIAAVLSNLSNDKFCAILPPSCDGRKEEKSNIHRGRELCQGLSLDSVDFRSIQNFIESQMDGTSSSLSSGSPSHGDLEHNRSNRFKKIDRLERLRKMDDLRDQLNRLSSQKGLENRYKNKGPGLLQEQISYRHLEQHPCGFDGDSILDSDIIDSYYDQGNPPRYPPPDPFSPTHSHYHCGHGQPHIPYNCSAWEFNSYYQSSYAGMPSDIYVSKKKIAKFQCGRCSKALMLSFPATNSDDAKLSNKEVNRKPNKPVHNSVVGMEGGYSFSAECSRGDPVSISEECGASISRSFSGRTRAAVAASGSGKKVSDSALHRLMGKPVVTAQQSV
uniref:Enhanced disease resistance 4-like N-terminal domain-containing protein n=1 Tax=Oryza rufipogon TaxID=4529 RepID=A0A0E0R3F9_ORYRU